MLASLHAWNDHHRQYRQYKQMCVDICMEPWGRCSGVPVLPSYCLHTAFVLPALPVPPSLHVHLHAAQRGDGDDAGVAQLGCVADRAEAEAVHEQAEDDTGLQHRKVLAQAVAGALQVGGGWVGGGVGFCWPRQLRGPFRSGGGGGGAGHQLVTLPSISHAAIWVWGETDGVG